MATSIETISVPDFYFGRCLFITGATGFMGKVLLEKLLRSCPGISKIYVLIRPGKNGEQPQDKLAKMRGFSCFDRLKKERPGDLESKVIAISGDMTKLNLGLSIDDRNRIMQEVSLVYHVAATVRFNQPLKDAILMNVRGTREVCKLVNDVRNFNKETILVHISTAYAYTSKQIVDEILYPSEVDWQQTILIAESLDEFSLQILSDKYMHVFPNTYTFTKSLAEDVVDDMCGHGANTIIVRPSIVISTAKEPMAGWIDNFNGPVAIVAATATGIVRISYADFNVSPDYMAVDIAIKAIILATWKSFVNKRSNRGLNSTEVYNSTAYRSKSITCKEMADIALKVSFQVALNNMLWYPSSSATKNKLWYYVNFMIFHMIPAIILDTVLNVFGVKQRSLIKIQRKIYTATMSLSYFSMNQWDFINSKMLALENDLSDADREDFGYDIDSIDNFEYFKNTSLGVKKYLLKEDMTKLDSDIARTKMLYYLDKMVNIVFYGGVIWFTIFKIDLLQIIMNL